MKLVIEISERVVRHVKINYMDISENDYAMICDAVRTATPYEERPHGEWKLRSPYEAWFEEYKCSNCNAYGWFNWHFCPNCGADMRKEGDPE